MAKLIKSLKGESIDFDLFNIKAQMANAPKNDNVSNRERYVNKKRRRGLNKKIDKMAQTKILEEQNFDAAVKNELKVLEQKLDETHKQSENVGEEGTSNSTEENQASTTMEKRTRKINR